MTKTLLLLRHADSCQKFYADDFERPLSEEGVATAPKIAQTFSRENLNPDLILCSSSKRAQQTLTLFQEAKSLTGNVRFENDLYLAKSEAVVEKIENFDEELNTVLLVGHAPTFDKLSLYLTGTDLTSPEAPALHFSPGCLAVFTLDISSWKDLHPGCAITYTYFPLNIETETQDDT